MIILDKKIIFVPTEKSKYYSSHKNSIIHGYEETAKAIKEEVVVKTTQMCLLSTRLIVDCGFSVYVVEENDKLIEIKLGDNKSTNRYIREGHNLFKLWESGEFE